jgi:hypothetical protein
MEVARKKKPPEDGSQFFLRNRLPSDATCKFGYRRFLPLSDRNIYHTLSRLNFCMPQGIYRG